MNREIETRRMCVHCGVHFLQGGRSWCAFCTMDSRNNHGVCSFCNRDIVEFSGCWSVRREMDKARVRHAMPDHLCPQCKDFNEELREMEVVELLVSPERRVVRMVCTMCETTLVQHFTLYRPPPKRRGFE